MNNILEIKNRKNLKEDFSGMDYVYEKCLNKEHFNNYNKKVNYQYNSKGFRDKEWPNDLSEVVWCLGDSFTLGFGQPFEETWPALLEKQINKRCLNLGEDGCSNDTIALRAELIAKQYNPKLMVIMWSYLHRRRKNNNNIEHDKEDFGMHNDINNFFKNLQLIDNLNCKTIQLVVPKPFLPNEEEAIKTIMFRLNPSIKNLFFVPQLDYSRDYHHFDIKTSKYVTNIIDQRI